MPISFQCYRFSLSVLPYTCLNTSAVNFVHPISLFLFSFLLFNISLKLQWEDTSLQPADDLAVKTLFTFFKLLTVPLFLSLPFFIPASPISYIPNYNLIIIIIIIVLL